ncbi:hypothetical protein L3Q67_01885 [Saccharothrix sp. AJ9571]|nr:hypothetical protein L3Q67_01885 [Saccharothrix sp. AJ9571]
MSTVIPDEWPDSMPSGRLVGASATIALYEYPGGHAIAALPARTGDADTWVPIISEQPGWARVLLPVHPQGTSAWVFLEDSAVRTGFSPYQVILERATNTLYLYLGNSLLEAWKVSLGITVADAPEGRTYVTGLDTSAGDSEQSVQLGMPLQPPSEDATSYLTIRSAEGGNVDNPASIAAPADAIVILTRELLLGTPVLIR